MWQKLFDKGQITTKFNYTDVGIDLNFFGQTI